VATTNNFDCTVTILTGCGTSTVPPCAGPGTFTNPQALEVGAAPEGLAAGFIDGDQNIDLVVTNSAGGDGGGGSITVLKGQGGDVFEPQPEIPITCGSVDDCVPVAVALADFDGDHNLDVAVANNDDDSVTTLLGNGDLTFRPGLTASVASIPDGIVAEDLTGDGHADIASASFFDDKVTVLIGTGDGHFVSPTSQLAADAASGTQTFVLTDASGFPNSGTVQVADNRYDYTSKSGNTLNLADPLIGDTAAATPVAFAGVDIAVGAAPGGVTAGDFNGDQKPDLATPNQDDGTATVLLNTTTTTMTCVGDCSGDGMVTVDELLTMVNIALGNAPISECPAGDANNDMQITVDEILTAVNNALNGCPL
jgi:hypothetical protein